MASGHSGPLARLIAYLSCGVRNVSHGYGRNTLHSGHLRGVRSRRRRSIRQWLLVGCCDHRRNRREAENVVICGLPNDLYRRSEGMTAVPPGAEGRRSSALGQRETSSSSHWLRRSSNGGVSRSQTARVLLLMMTASMGEARLVPD